MPSINLAPGTQYIITARRRRVRLYSIGVGIIVLFLLGWLILFIYVQVLTKSSDTVKSQIEAADQKTQTLHDDAVRVALFEKRLVDVASLVDNHIGWDKVFADFERLLPPDTVLTSLDATNGNTSISIQGTTQNIDQVALALASLSKDVNHPSVFENGTVKTIQRQEQKTGDTTSVLVYTFAMTLDFNRSSLSNKTAL